jgi:outer membrane protein TolC
MNRLTKFSLPFLLILSTSSSFSQALASPSSFELSLKEAETRALDASNQLKALSSDRDAATERADAQYSALFPRLTLGGTFQYLTEVPTVNLPIPGFGGGLTFGSHINYSVGPTLSYTLWDTGAARDAYRGYDLLSQAKEEDRKEGTIQLLYQVRASYLRVQLALEELRLLNSSLELSRAQNRDIAANFRAGAATRLDLVESQRDVLSYELQFQQKQAELASDLKDLLALVQETPPGDPTLPGPPGTPRVGLELKLDSFAESLAEAKRLSFQAPGPSHPELKSQELLTASAESAAQSQKDTLYPTLQVSATAALEYPNAIVLERVEQNIFTVSLSMPLFEANRTRHLAAEKLKQADTARFNREQTRINLDRDYRKAVELLASLRAQRKLATEDVRRSAEAARLYYRSYKGGKINLIDVQSANNRALLSQVNAARIDAQILNQLFTLQSLSGEPTRYGH